MERYGPARRRRENGVASSLDLCALDIVDVSPPYYPEGITALAAHCNVLEMLTAMALHRADRPAAP